jgi:hypothetical protein
MAEGLAQLVERIAFGSHTFLLWRLFGGEREICGGSMCWPAWLAVKTTLARASFPSA